MRSTSALYVTEFRQPSNKWILNVTITLLFLFEAELVANLQFPSRYSLLVERSKASGTRKVGFFNIYTALGLHRVTAPSDRYDAVIS